MQTKRVNTNGFALDQLRLESLNRKAMQGRSAIQKNGMSFGNFIKDVPDLGRLALNQFLRAAHGVDVALLLEASDDERLEEDQAPSSSADRIDSV